MRWLRWTLLALALVAIGLGEWRLAISIGTDMHRKGDPEASGPPYEIRLAGNPLKGRIASELVLVNSSRMVRMDTSIGDAVVVEGVRYETNAGVVRATGQLRDMRDARRVLAVMDAYDVDRNYLTSSAAPVATTRGVPVSFALAMPDRVDLASLSFRVLHEGDKSEIPSLSQQDVDKRRSDMQGRAVLLADDAVIPSDLPEVVERLRHLGYIDDDDTGVGEPGLKVVFNRFRKDHGLPPTRLVDIETFLAVRIVSSDFKPSVQAEL